METKIIIFSLLGFIFGVFAGAWGLPKQVSQTIGKIKRNGSAEVDMVAKKPLKKDRRFLGIFKRRKR